jgi:hypothetical protein
MALTAPQDSVRHVGDSDAPWVDTGIGVDLDADRSVESVTDGPGMLEAYYPMLEAAGQPRPNRIVH